MFASVNNSGRIKLWMLMAASATIVILVVFVYLIGRVSRAQMKRNEASAISLCRTISSTQEFYKTRYKTYASLEQLVGTGFVVKDILSGEKDGYRFAIEIEDDGKDWSMTADPVEPGTTGERSFRISSDGVIYVSIAADVHYDPEEGPVLRVDSTKLSQTIVTGHMEALISEGKNVLYCSSFQLAWNELKQYFGTREIKLTEEPPLVRFLNKSLSTSEDICEKNCLAVAGPLTREFLDDLNYALRRKFGDEAPFVTVEGMGQEWFIAYGFIFKDLEFTKHFESLREPVYFESSKGTTGVKAFGIKQFVEENSHHMKMAEQVTIFEYKDDSHFIVRLQPDSKQDEIVLAKVSPGKTLLQTIETVMATVTGDKDSLDQGDTMQIPTFNFDITHSYAETLGKHVIREENHYGPIEAALQGIRFKLNEKGARLRSFGMVIGSNGGETEHDNLPRKFIFDRPFLIYLKEKGAKYPYFALWVDNPELLVKQ